MGGLVKQCRFSSPPSPILICVEKVLDAALKPEPQQMEKKSGQIKTAQLRVLIETPEVGQHEPACCTALRHPPAHVLSLQHQVETSADLSLSPPEPPLSQDSVPTERSLRFLLRTRQHGEFPGLVP